MIRPPTSDGRHQTVKRNEYLITTYLNRNIQYSRLNAQSSLVEFLISSCFAQRLIQVLNNVAHILNPDGKPHQVRGNAAGTLGLLGEL